MRIARLWPWRSEDLRKAACQRLNKSFALKDEDWKLYLPDEPAPKTCQ